MSYFGYGVGQCFSFGLVGSFILYFYTDILGISPIAASTIFLIARVWDAVNDPLIAGYMDTLDSRFGKFRPYMLFTPVLIVLVTVAAFYNIDADTSTKVMYAGITYILWGTLYTISDVPFWSMSSVMTDEPQERAKAATCAMLGVNAGIGATLVVFPKLSAYFADGRADQGYLPAVIVLMIAGLFFMLNGFYNTKERISTKSCEKVTLKQTFQAVRKNKPLFFILAAFFMNVFFNLVNGLYIFFFTYNMGDAGLVSLIGTITLVSAIACLATPVLTKRFKKRDIFIALCVLEIIARIGFYFTGYDNPTVVMAWLAVITGIFMMTNPLISAMIADTVEYSYYYSGKRTAAITFSGQTFTGKLSVAVAGGLTGLILTMIGYVPNAAQTETALNGMFFCIALLPVLGALVRIFIMSRYTFTEDQHAILREKLQRGEFAEGVDVKSVKPHEALS
ncbi:MFS transporter [Vibrio parahaemolyticus]|nr:MFS transporter [Vibrio parahaemolyticus]EJC7126248.1 MFS transporter [Vibrio parahaemolyticus]EJG0218485.1 MFS transporter [Vibrio parahaemolyticus]EJG0228022.1 MFS transporter [Vibrio parahaemolyticus]EJG0246722.1 MFS transporter [Vibrio parahaemolyticus]